MKSEKQTKAQQIAALQRQLEDALAGQVHQYHFASHGVEKASVKHFQASGVVLTLTALGGRELVKPVLIRNGLSLETVAALRADFQRSYDDAVVFNPAAVPKT